MAGSKTEYVYLKGKASYLRPFTPDMTYDPPKWSYKHYPDAESLDIIWDLKKQGVKNEVKKDDDGYFVRLSRPTYIKRIVMNAETKVPLQPPKVLDKDGNPIESGMFGNGTVVNTKMEVYSHSTPNGGKAKAMRWFATRIDDLVPFEKKEDFTNDEAKAFAGFETQEVQREEPF